MIRRSLEAIRDDLQTYFDLKDPENDRKVFVALSNLLGQDGQHAFEEANKDSADHVLVITMVNIEQENHLKPPPQIKPFASGFEGKTNPPQNINLYILISAFSSQYETSLSMVSSTISFFQKKPFFDSSNTPSLHPQIKRMVADMHSLTFEQQNYLWGIIGAKYMPSVMYKLRTLSIEEEEITDIAKPVLDVNFPGLQ